MSGKTGKRGSNKEVSSSSTGRSAVSMRARSGIKRKRVDTESKEEISEEAPSSMSTEPPSSSSVASSSSTRQSQRAIGVRKRKREEGPIGTESKEEISDEVPSSMITVPPSSSVASSSSPLNTVDIKSNSEVSPKEPERRECERKIKELDSQLEEIKEQIAGLDRQHTEENDLENAKRLFKNMKVLLAKENELNLKLKDLRYQLEQSRQTSNKCVHTVDFLFDLFSHFL
jgi:hypothetical protein